MANCNLTQAEIDDICAPLTQPAAQIRYLESIGLVVGRKPNGRPIVSRAHYESVMGGKAAPINGPKWSVPA